MTKSWVYFCLLMPVLAVGCGSSSKSVTSVASISPSAVAFRSASQSNFKQRCLLAPRHYVVR